MILFFSLLQVIQLKMQNTHFHIFGVFFPNIIGNCIFFFLEDCIENGHTANYVQCIISYNLFKCFGAKDQIANGKTISMRVEKRSQLACEANFTRRYFFIDAS